MLETGNINPHLLHSWRNGAIARQILLNKAENEFSKGNFQDSVYYQVSYLYGILQEKYFNQNNGVTEVISKSTESDDKDLELDNNLHRYIKNSLGNNPNENKDFFMEFMISCNFLEDVVDPHFGYLKILEVCKEFPKEWTVLQVYKGLRPQTTYSKFREIHDQEADIYVSILKHMRSEEYPEPICIRISDHSQIEMFKEFAKISDLCKEYMGIDPKNVETREAKSKYWDNLRKLDNCIRSLIVEFKAYIFPYIFVFRGIPSTTVMSSKKYQEEIFAEVDSLCSSSNLKNHNRVLLSLAALQVPFLSLLEMKAISEELSNHKNVQIAIQQLLEKLKESFFALEKSSHPQENYKYFATSSKHTSFPCILVVDERLDHFYWEELNVDQEMCRFNSMQCLYALHKAYKHRIEKGYLQLNLKSGACVINPDKNLLKTEMRMGSFFKYWAPSWTLKLGERASPEELLDDFFKRDCFFYGGHGSGLQHISGKKISKQSIEAVVFLFGCDSTRMHSSGLFSDLIGSHYYYHAAMCPCIIGTIFPALDGKMDEISAEILARCIAPESKRIAMWNQINTKLWTKEGIIECSDKTNNTIKETQEYQIPSLCGALTRIHSDGKGKSFYNTVPYVCRGLPIWNSDLQPLPK